MKDLQDARYNILIWRCRTDDGLALKPSLRVTWLM